MWQAFILFCYSQLFLWNFYFFNLSFSKILCYLLLKVSIFLIPFIWRLNFNWKYGKKIDNNIYFNQFYKWLYFCCWNCRNVSDRIAIISNIHSNIKWFVNASLSFILKWENFVVFVGFCVFLFSLWFFKLQDLEIFQRKLKNKAPNTIIKVSRWTPRMLNLHARNWILRKASLRISQYIVYMFHTKYERTASILFKCCGQKRDDNKSKFDTKYIWKWILTGGNNCNVCACLYI